MKKISRRISVFFSLMIVLLLIGCKGPIKTADSGVTLNLDNYEGISTSIDILCTSGNWQQDLFVKIVNGIDGAAGSGIIDKDMFQDRDLKEKLLKKSCFYLYTGIDSTFKCSTYCDIDTWKVMIPFLKKQNTDFIYSGVKLDATNEHISIVEDILMHYGVVLGLSQSTCYKKPIYLKDYSCDLASIRSEIKQDKYYAVYFGYNQEIQNNMDELEGRRDHAHKAYMAELEKLIEERAVSDSFSLSDLLNVQNKFNQMARNAGANNAIQALNDFINNYVDPTAKPPVYV